MCPKRGGKYVEILIFMVTILMILFSGCSEGVKNTDSIVWDIDNTKKINNHEITAFGAPIIVDTPYGKGLQFDGVNDGLLLDINPLAGAKKFTIELIFRPDSGGNKEQRFLHIGEINGDRIMIETRLTEDDQWFLDTYIKSDESERTLYAKTFLHPVDQWYSVALIYEGKIMRHLVNNEEELVGPVDFVPMRTGRTSIGCRMNQLYWFKGVIKRIKFTPRVLSPDELRQTYNR
jgi:hypothetical protein